MQNTVHLVYLVKFLDRPNNGQNVPDTNSTIDRWFPNSRSMRTCPESRPPLHQSLLTNHARCPHNPTPHGGPPSSRCTFSISLSSFNLRVSSGWSYFFLLKFGFKILSLFEKIISCFCYQFFYFQYFSAINDFFILNFCFQIMFLNIFIFKIFYLTLSQILFPKFFQHKVFFSISALSFWS